MKYTSRPTPIRARKAWDHFLSLRLANPGRVPANFYGKPQFTGNWGYTNPGVKT